MSTKQGLINLVGEAEAKAYLESVEWLSDDLAEKGIKFKGADRLDRFLEGLGEDDLKKLYTKLNKLLGPERVIYRDPVGSPSQSKVVLTYTPRLNLPKRSAKQILAMTLKESVDAIADHKAKTKKKVKQFHSPLEITCQQGIDVILDHRKNRGKS